MKKIILLIFAIHFISCRVENKKDSTIIESEISETNRATTSIIDNKSDDFKISDEVFNNWLQVGIGEKLVNSRMGGKYSIRKIGYSEVDGYYYEEWVYPVDGTKLLMQSEEPESERSVSEITIKSPSNLTNLQGIGIGSSRDDILKVYPNAAQTDTSPDIMVAGNIYEGIFFTIKKDKISEIFVGSLAE